MPPGIPFAKCRTCLYNFSKIQRSWGIGGLPFKIQRTETWISKRAPQKSRLKCINFSCNMQKLSFHKFRMIQYSCNILPPTGCVIFCVVGRCQHQRPDWFLVVTGSPGTNQRHNKGQCRVCLFVFFPGGGTGGGEEFVESGWGPRKTGEWVLPKLRRLVTSLFCSVHTRRASGFVLGSGGTVSALKGMLTFKLR